MASATGLKTALTVGALATMAASGVLSSKVDTSSGSAVHGATEPSAQTPSDMASAQKALRVVQWATPLLTGAILS